MSFSWCFAYQTTMFSQATVVWVKILPDGNISACLSSAPSVSFDLSCQSKVGKLPVKLEKPLKKWFTEKIQKFAVEKFVNPNWQILKR